MQAHKSISPIQTVMQSVQSFSPTDLKMVILPLILQGRYFQALFDTGSSLSLIQETYWRQLSHRGQLIQTFKLANGQVLSALGLCEEESPTTKLVTWFGFVLILCPMPVIVSWQSLLPNEKVQPKFLNVLALLIVQCLF